MIKLKTEIVNNFYVYSYYSQEDLFLLVEEEKCLKKRIKKMKKMKKKRKKKNGL